MSFAKATQIPPEAISEAKPKPYFKAAYLRLLLASCNEVRQKMYVEER
jgi:hypothetical protein